MSRLRTDADLRDGKTGFDMTAAMAAAARASETGQPDPLIRDPYARLLIADAGIGIWKALLDDSLFAKLKSADPGTAAYLDCLRSYQAVRTQFFDEYITDAVTRNIRQVVIVASGLDSRAYRLDWPAGTTVYEIDRPEVLDYKFKILASQGVAPAVDLREVSVDLRHDWPAAMWGAGFNPLLPTAWLVEGLLVFLPADAQDRLLGQIGELSAVGSRLAVETAASYAKGSREEMRQRFRDIAAELGLVQPTHLQDLMYNDPDRAVVTDWLNTHGWHATARNSGDELRRLHRWNGGGPIAEDKDAFADFVTAERR